MKIAMIGGGYVGLVSGACFADLGVAVYNDEGATRKLEQLHEGSPWLVDNPQKELLTIMTPVFPDPHTLSFLKNQVCSWIKFSAGSCLYHRVSVVLRLCSLCCARQFCGR